MARPDGGKLVTDGNHCITGAYPPFRPGQAGIADYVVEADVQVNSLTEGDCFNIIARRDKAT